jgi:hypothetical protein
MEHFIIFFLIRFTDRFVFYLGASTIPQIIEVFNRYIF